MSSPSFEAPFTDGVHVTPCRRSSRVDKCTVSVTRVAFGNYNTSSALPNDSQGVVTCRCSGAGIGSVQVQIGAGTSGRISQRTMRGPGGVVHYNLYLDVVRQVIWGDGAHGSQVFRSSSVTPGQTISVPIYARVPAGQSIAQGLYEDTLAVTILF